MVSSVPWKHEITKFDSWLPDCKQVTAVRFRFSRLDHGKGLVNHLAYQTGSVAKTLKKRIASGNSFVYRKKTYKKFTLQ